MSKIDLHIHSIYSDDGELSPQEIIKASKENGMELIAITDHNSVGGVAAAFDEADGLHILSGVEFDCVYKGVNFHLLGYGFDYKREEFAQIEQDILDQERKASKEKIHLFQEATGIPLEETEVLKKAWNGVVPGELIGEILLAREDAHQHRILRPYLPHGSKSDMPNVHFYWDYFSQGKVAYVPICYQTLEAAVELIHKAGGMAVLAHPGQNLRDRAHLLSEIVGIGIDGIEVFSSYHTKEQCDYYEEVAKKHKLMVTAGSDYHGKHKPHISLGGHGGSWSDKKLLAEVFGLNG